MYVCFLAGRKLEDRSLRLRNYLAGEEALSNVQGNASQSQERKILEI